MILKKDKDSTPIKMAQFTKEIGEKEKNKEKES